ncbi:phosphatidylinositol alpha-1,6-mannosyltransferase [Stackebrandtia albiflava]|uniref:Phosphatidylinositol alpha-1,6-mannosyltransferase n=1 Tax=Stackebrandtia albiflava TaxID=406432 RepID=A0A562VGX6_9ACTN|nr:glycosyltransferase family 4 protein [Stackebrandtia albiflava]TWJ17122.1 phosphatidylinositol alpha-1,6-mannosyltransferase [Stackebrandtia albiflava]
MTRVLLVTNDFPPRQGGIQSFVHGMAERLPVEHLVVYCSTSEGAAGFDARQPFPVVRERTGMLLPTPGVARRAAEIARRHDCDAVLFGAAAPLGLLAAGLKRRTGIRRAVAITHGHEVGWAMLPGARALLRRIATHNDVVTYLTDYTRRRLAPAIGGLTALEQLTFGIDVERFHPGVDGEPVRSRHGLGDAPVVVCVSRLVPRKGQDTLIDAFPRVRERVPDARLLLVGGGPYESALRRRIAATGQTDAVTITGAVPQEELPAHYAAGDVFAMPCRTRRAGMDVEGLGVVYLEASATGLPVIAGDSGGAPAAVRDGHTGHVVPGGDAATLADRLTALLTDPEAAAGMGRAGREWMCEAWTWPTLAERLRTMLTPPE